MTKITKYITDFMKLISDSTKLELILSLKNGKKTAKAIEQELEISQAYTSQQLKRLKKAGLLQSERINNIKHYSIKNNKIFDIISSISKVVLQIEKEKMLDLEKLKEII